MTTPSEGTTLRPPPGTTAGDSLRDSVAARLAGVRARITAAGGAPERITVVAVTKGFGPEFVEAALSAGVADIGENYAQELEGKLAGLEPATAKRCRWHLLGKVQRNKVRRVAGSVHLWQSVDRRPAGEEIARRANGALVLVQVNVSGDGAKNGCSFDEAPALVDDLVALGLDVRGLMAVGPLGPPEAARPGFHKLTALADHLGLPERSMGMTDDLEVAVQEGTTMVRVGRGLFGPRPVPSELQR
ncbi:MAG: YggS family pyridoxal phosphate-dependent enzyme [Acidimicrobiales bacterium]